MTDQPHHAVERRGWRSPRSSRVSGGAGGRRSRPPPARALAARATSLWALPGTLWLFVFLIAPVVMIVLVSFWERSATSGFDSWAWTIDNYRGCSTPRSTPTALWRTFRNTVIVCVICLAIGYPIAYFLASA